VPRRKKTTAAAFAQYSSLALMLPLSTFIGYLLGRWLDKMFGTTWLSILFLILGSVGGFVALIREIMQDSGDEDPR
jgi:F0F1-type ATP synthase assembly protein I